MKKIVILNVLTFALVFLILAGLYIADLVRGVSCRAPMPIEVLLNILGVVFLITAILVWLFAWGVLIRRWSSQSFWVNMLTFAVLCFGNVLGAYLVLYVFNRDAERDKRISGTGFQS